MLFFRRKKKEQNQYTQTNKNQDINKKTGYKANQLNSAGPQIQKIPSFQNESPTVTPTPMMNRTPITNNQDFLNQPIIPPPNPQPNPQPNQINRVIPSGNEEVKPEATKEPGFFYNTPEAKVIDYKKIEEKSKLFDKFKKEAETEEPNMYEGTPNKMEGTENKNALHKEADVSSLKPDKINELLSNEEEYSKEDIEEKKEHFISLNDYKQSIKEFNNLKRSLSNSEITIDELKEEIGKQDNKLKELKDKFEDIERKLVLIDKLLSEGGENGGE